MCPLLEVPLIPRNSLVLAPRVYPIEFGIVRGWLVLFSELNPQGLTIEFISSTESLRHGKWVQMRVGKDLV